jgi:tetratricopeptide (TPR) repeat protein
MKDLPAILYFVVRETGRYSVSSAWAEFDTLRLRAIDDLFWVGEAIERRIYAWTSEPKSPEGTHVVPIPTQVALERVYFHISEPHALVLDASSVGADCSRPQCDITVNVAHTGDEPRVITRSELPELIGSLASGPKAVKSPLLYAEKALTKGALFETFALGRRARIASEGATERAWFFELFSRSFFGMPEEALAAYDEYPARGSAEPRAQLLAARYRLLLRQFNEARTILHTLSFDSELGVIALCEMARSYLIEKDFARAIDIASSAIQREPNYIESYLVRGIAHRGVSYEAGDTQGLQDAHHDFERVARLGNYAIAEALYHVGTVCARLGALSQAEMAFRQSLFQRDRISARDALIRLLCAQEKRDAAQEELERLEQIDPGYASRIREQLGEALRGATTARERVELRSQNVESALQAARDAFAAWNIPLRGDVSDCAWLDEMINRFAPDGDFPTSGDFSCLSGVNHREIARAFALHIGDILVKRGAATWSSESGDSLLLISARQNAPIPIERFVSERILLGASGDNFSSLESLIVELNVVPPTVEESLTTGWWVAAPSALIARYKEEAAWAKDRWLELGAALTEELSDLDEIDRVIDEVFAPGGVLQENVTISFAREMDRFVRGTGLLIGGIIADCVTVTWSDHDRAEGISLYNRELGRIFPVAKVQRRVYLASAADFASKLSGLAWSTAVASVTEGIRSGTYRDAERVRAALMSSLPSIRQFPESELSGVVESLLIGATLK